MSAGRVFVRQLSPQGFDYVAMTATPMRHRNRLSEQERQQAKAERSMQRYVSISVRATRMICNPFSDPAELATLRRERSRRASVIYGRLAKLAKGGAR